MKNSKNSDFFLSNDVHMVFIAQKLAELRTLKVGAKIAKITDFLSGGRPGLHELQSADPASCTFLPVISRIMVGFA